MDNKKYGHLLGNLFVFPCFSPTDNNSHKWCCFLRKFFTLEVRLGKLFLKHIIKNALSNNKQGAVKNKPNQIDLMIY